MTPPFRQISSSHVLVFLCPVFMLAQYGCASSSKGIDLDTDSGDPVDDDAIGDVLVDSDTPETIDTVDATDTVPADVVTEELPLPDSDICESCETHDDCGPLARCIGLTTGEFVCAATCVPDLPECPRGFDCIMNYFADDITVCVPIGESCCIDEDADGYGQGIGCFGEDCDDEDIARNPGEDELCNTIDDDCDTIVDEEVVDCGTFSCHEMGDGTYEQLEPGVCALGTCTDQPDDSCALYTCDGGAEEGDACATTCAPAGVDDDDFCILAAHCEVAACASDLVNGEPCDEDSDCGSEHCDNEFCCDSGICCQDVEDCPGGAGVVTVCDNEATCQGTRGEGVCESFRCSTASGIPDDTACDSSIEASECGFFVSVYCTGVADQSPPLCATTCGSDAECDTDAHCDTACVPDLVDGSICDEPSDCVSGHCNDNICCASGDCCLTPDDCPLFYSSDPVCVSLTTCQGTIDVATCIDFVCATLDDEDDDSACGTGVEAQDCNLYPSQYCSGGSDQPYPVCASACTADAECDAIAHCDLNSCVPDLPDGSPCDEASDCVSDHCQNSFCCASGDCCSIASNCAGAYSSPSTCDSMSTCQGTRVDPACDGSHMCQFGATVPDDTGCTAGMESSDCGPYPAIQCTGAADQDPDQAGLCPTSCASHADCDVGAHCDPILLVCVTDGGVGDPCVGSYECLSGLQCVDHVCCTSSCAGTCEVCDLAGNEGTCSPVPEGDDPDGECLGLNCSGYYWGWVADSCLGLSDASSNDVGCDGANACQTSADVCPSMGQGSIAMTCDALCQDPDPLTCQDTTAPACDNVTPAPSTQTCGTGACQVTVPRCNSGTPVSCVPGSPTFETCNDVDDDCDTQIDEGLSADALEPSYSCSVYTNLGTIYTMESGSEHSTVTVTPTLYGSGDVDAFRVAMEENDTSCGCPGISVDEDYAITAQLTVPLGAGSYEVCNTQGSCAVANCTTVAAGSTGSVIVWKDGCCSPIGCDDSGTWWIFVRPVGAPGFECHTYILNAFTSQGCR